MYAGLTSETHDCQGTGDGKSACETQNFGATEYRAINEENAVASSVAASTKTVGNPHKQSESEEPCKRCKEWEGKYNDLQKLCLRLTIRNSEMDLKYEDLLKTKTGANQFVAVSNMTVADTDVHFTARELKFLECMSLEKKFDSTFVHHCLQFAYKDNLQVLTQKSLKGTAEVVLIAENGDVEKTIPGKDPLTPVKIEKIRSLFIERISKCQLNPVAYSERIKDAYLNRLIGSGVTNIAKKKYESL